MKNLLLVLAISFISITSHSQEKNESEKDYSKNVSTLNNTIESLYHVISGEKGTERDWALFKFLFKPNAKLIPSWKNKEGIYEIRYMKPDDYIKNSEKWLVENGFFEKEIHRKVDTFGKISQVFSTYESFYSEADEKPFMRGINSIQLLNDGERWWIVNIYWTQETERQPIPKEFLR
ncbi:hypothetical protein [Thalassobellus suaedae]|uniref:Nuclear transport factor 2 family protein n=1 Tax=Thalassobellus suaedae TaxID=3074124 RepID=A0ABY9Y4T8_9FLAO|nr:hypothetical protein RHP49_00860 [Flavobacteriaceae bacterium HL-DH10]